MSLGVMLGVFWLSAIEVSTGSMYDMSSTCGSDDVVYLQVDGYQRLDR